MPYSSYHVPKLSTVFSPVTANILHNTLTHILTLSYLAYQYKPSPPRCHALDGDAPYSAVGHHRFLEWSAAYPFPSILHAVVVHVQWVLVVSPNVLPPPLLFYPNSDVSRSPPMLELHPGLCWSLVTHLQPLIPAEPLAFHVSIDCFLMSLDFWSSSPPCSWIDLLHPTIFPPNQCTCATHLTYYSIFYHLTFHTSSHIVVLIFSHSSCHGNLSSIHAFSSSDRIRCVIPLPLPTSIYRPTDRIPRLASLVRM